jgi:hypothetical protein
MTANDSNNTVCRESVGDGMTAFLPVFHECMRVCAYALGKKNAVMLSLLLGGNRGGMLSCAVIAVTGGVQ